MPGFAVDRMCAGALTATTAAAGEIAMGACDLAIAGGVEHMGHHPMGEDVDFNPRFVAERLIDESAAVMGQTAENLHDGFPQLTKEDADRYAAESQRRAAEAWDEPEGVYARTVVPMSVFTDEGWKVAERDEFLRPETTLEGLAGAADAVPRRRARHRRQLGRPHRRRDRVRCSPPRRPPRSSASSRACASSGSRTRASSRT